MITRGRVMNLRSTCGVPRIDGFRNEYIRVSIKIAFEEYRLEWYAHVMRRVGSY